MVDRKSRFLKCEKLTRLGSKEVQTAMIKALIGEPLYSVTPDRGREFQLHGKVTTELGVEFYFPPPHQPWQRGTNENTNGLLRELNHRPRKCLGYRTQVYYYVALDLTIRGAQRESSKEKRHLAGAAARS